MPDEDASLSDFAGGGGNDTGDSGESAVAGNSGESAVAGDSGESAVAGADDRDLPDAPDTTADWSPEGTTCERCGATVQRRWRDGDVAVCADCKEW